VEILRTGPRDFLVVDARSGTQLACGAEERYLIHLLETHDSDESRLQAFEQRFGKALPRRQVEEFFEQLRSLDLITDAPPVPATTGSAGFRASRPATPPPAVPEDSADRLNRFFDILAVLFGWILHPFWMIPVSIMVLLAANVLWHRWSDCQKSLLLPTHYLPPLVLYPLVGLQTIFLLNIPHSLLIGIVCRRFGGRVRSFSLRFYNNLLPQMHCDAGDSGMWMSRRGRWTLGTISMWCYLAVGSGMTLLWAASKPISGAAAFWIWMLPPCLLGIFCQVIPFFKFGGYAILSYLAEEPKLRERAIAETKAWLCGRTSPEALTDTERYWFHWYAIGFFLFRLLFDGCVLFVLAVWFTYKFKGAGAVAYVALILYWYRAGIGRILMSSSTLAWLVRRSGAWWFRWPMRVVLAAVVVGIGFIPYSYEVVGECRLVPRAQFGVRSQLNDEIVAVHVAEGDHVEPGTVIASLSGRYVRENYLSAQAERDRAQAQLDLLRAGFRPEAVKSAELLVDTWRIKVRYYEKLLRTEEKLAGTNAASRQQYDYYREQWDNAQQQLLMAQESLGKLKAGYREEEIRAAEASVQLQEQRVKYYEDMQKLTELMTPIAGKVITPYLAQKQGQHVNLGDLVAVIQDTSQLYVEVAADDAAGADVRPGMEVHVRLHAHTGRLLRGHVRQVSWTAEQDRLIDVSPVRTDPETFKEQGLNTRNKSDSYHVRVEVELDELPQDAIPEMTGYARIVVKEDDVFWRALARPIVRFLRTEVWSWLP
jgi:HlyD family secretion protein